MPAWGPPKLARGFLELLTGRTQGRTPQSVSDEVQPTLDMREFYSSSQLFVTSGGNTVGSMAVELLDPLAFTAQLGLKAIGATLVIGAAGGTNITLSLGILMPQSTEFAPITSQFIGGAAAGAVLHHGCVIPNGGWIVPAGAIIQARCSGNVAGADHSLDVHALIENFVSQV